MVEKAVSFADGLIDEIAARRGSSANILDELMPTWLRRAPDILTYVDMIETLESIYDIVNGTTTDGILHFLELPMKVVKATCPADESLSCTALPMPTNRSRPPAPPTPAAPGRRRRTGVRWLSPPPFARLPAAEARVQRAARACVRTRGSAVE